MSSTLSTVGRRPPHVSRACVPRAVVSVRSEILYILSTELLCVHCTWDNKEYKL